jgi:hypothetical protein
VSARAVMQLDRTGPPNGARPPNARIVSLGFVWQLWRSLWFHFRLNSRVGGQGNAVTPSELRLESNRERSA